MADPSGTDDYEQPLHVGYVFVTPAGSQMHDSVHTVDGPVEACTGGQIPGQQTGPALTAQHPYFVVELDGGVRPSGGPRCLFPR